MKTLSALLLIAVGITFGMPVASAEDKPAPAKQAHKKAPAKKAAPAKKEPAVIDEDDKEPDVSASANTDYQCELGNKLTIYRNADDEKHIALRWKKQLLRLTRVETTTGANRFENKKNGWVWIDIPTKGMLLDAKKGQQLANECKNPDQMLHKTSDTPKS
jgi:membrane-bound inhibitor of C-type lysozyme